MVKYDGKPTINVIETSRNGIVRYMLLKHNDPKLGQIVSTRTLNPSQLESTLQDYMQNGYSVVSILDIEEIAKISHSNDGSQLVKESDRIAKHGDTRYAAGVIEFE